MFISGDVGLMAKELEFRRAAQFPGKQACEIPPVFKGGRKRDIFITKTQKEKPGIGIVDKPVENFFLQQPAAFLDNFFCFDPFCLQCPVGHYNNT